MKTFTGLNRQIILSISAVVLCVIALALLGSYIFYYLLWTLWPPTDVELDGWLPSGMEWAWMILLTLVSLAVGTTAAIKLSRRIIMPLNSVTGGLQKLADGDLKIRSVSTGQTLDEVTLLVDNFNSLTKRLNRIAEEQAFWNAATAHELRTPLIILRGRLENLAEGLCEPSTSQYYSLLAQVEKLARLIENIQFLGLSNSRNLELNLHKNYLAAEIESELKPFESKPVNLSPQTTGYVLQRIYTRKSHTNTRPGSNKFCWIAFDGAPPREGDHSSLQEK